MTSARSSSRQYWLVKLSSLFLVAIAVVSTTGGVPPAYRFGGLMIPGTLLVAACFALTVAELKVTAKGVEYRRFLRWRAVPASEIASAGRFWSLGYLRSWGFIPPWGPVFFALTGAFGWRDPLIVAVREHAAVSPRQLRTGRWGIRLLFMALGAGVTFMCVFLAPSNMIAAARDWPTQALPGMRFLAQAEAVFWGLWGAFLLATGSGTRHPRLYWFLGGVSLAWFAFAAPSVLH